MTFNLSEFKRLAEKRTKTPWSFDGSIGIEDAEFFVYVDKHADAIIERLEKLEKVAEVLKAWCQDDPRDSYSEKLHDALEALERGE